jgi:hypothetical protein
MKDEHYELILVLIQDREHVGRVLSGIDGPLERAVAGVDPGVVPGADRIEAEGEARSRTASNSV